MAFLDRFPLYPEEVAAAPSTVCVTGVTGFTAGYLVARLLASGHTVHGTCRAPEKADTVAHLTALPGAAERLRLFKADLCVQGAFDGAMQGCSVVLHTAAPYLPTVSRSDFQHKFYAPIVQGTVNVLESVNRTPSVKRVVMSSAIAAHYHSPATDHRDGPRHVYTEEDWNTRSTETCLPHYYCKTQAERKAWEMAKAQQRWTLVTLSPCMMFGPLMNKQQGGHVGATMLRDMIANKAYPAAPLVGFAMVDVRDVAAAHCLAMVHPGAQGRYLVTRTSLWIKEVCELLRKLFPHSRVKVPVATAPKTLLWVIGPALGMPRDMVENLMGTISRFDSSRVQRELGLRIHDIEDAVKEEVESMLALGLVKHL